FAVGQAREAVEALWSCYGAQGLYTRDPLQRHLRDVLAINQHFSFNFDIAGAAYGLFALGGRYANPTMSAAAAATRRRRDVQPRVGQDLSSSAARTIQLGV